MSWEKFKLDGKVAVITGGAGLLGRQHAFALAEAGATLAITDVREAEAQRAADDVHREYGGTAVGLAMDVTDPSSIQYAKRTLLTRFGGIHVLLNNAAIDAKVKADGGGVKETSRIENFSLQQWNLELSVGLTGAFLCAQVFGTHMAASGGGVILNIASDLSVIAPDQRLYRKDGVPEERQPVKPVTYSVIKTGLVGLTRYLATYWAKQDVRVNALSPGGVRNQQPDEFVERLTNLIPMGRMAAPDEYRGAIQFLCSDASSYLTGQNIVIDGGRSIQ
jgi:NAD(P)-dependent dehydrogenase (short-subunit alcohol dehydrogenase family)